MPRRSDFWIFNIRQDNWKYCVQGPSDAERHGVSNIRNPWFGRQSKSCPELRKGDIVFARRTTRSREGEKGDEPHGVMALWKYTGKRKVNTDESLPWTGGSYEWIFYLREIESLKRPYQEDYDNLPFISQSLQSDVIGLRPEYARGYFEEISNQNLVSKKNLTIARDYFETIENSATDTRHPPSNSTKTEQRRYTTTVDKRLRNPRIVNQIKDVYVDKCQVCHERRLQGPDIGYSEVHHIKPLGRPYVGSDLMENMVVLCPNHHADFDNGVISIDPTTREISHLYEQNVDGEILHNKKPHRIDEKYLKYHAKKLSILGN